jgi:hypothetical protein
MAVFPTVTLDLPQSAALPLQACFLVAGSVWQVSTNAPEVIDILRQCVDPTQPGAIGPVLSIGIQIDFERTNLPPWPQPYFRGLDHMVYAAYDSGNSMLVDLLRRRAMASISYAMATDLAYWKRVFLPVLLGLTSLSLGITPLHCACLVRNHRGLLLGGQSGAGKSTLALALALGGLSFLSDDWTYFSRSDRTVHAWGLPTPVKLLPDAVRHFPKLRNNTAGISLNGEIAHEVDPSELFGVDRSLDCDPGWLVFIERAANSNPMFSRITPADAASRLEVDLETQPPCLAHLREYQMNTIDALVDRDCWVLRHGIPPTPLAEELIKFLDTH